jgi:hypothetical protein
MTISDSDSFNLVPMTGPAAQADPTDIPFFSFGADTPLPSPELHPLILYPTADMRQPDAIEAINPETIAVNPHQPMRFDNDWLDGDSLTYRCPECASPISIRHWLMVADCWNCQAAVLLSADHEAAIEQLLRKTSRHSVPSPTAVPQPEPRIAKPRPILPYFPAARKTEAHDRIRTTVVQEQPLLWIRSAFNQLPAWIVSLLAHILLLILLGLLSNTDNQGDAYITLSVVVGDKGGGVTTNLTADAETNYDLPPPDNIDPDNPLAMEKVEHDREIAEELQQDFDTNNPNLPDIDSVKKRINEATGTNKTILARDPRVRKQIVSREGGTSATEAAVARGLAWLAKHQSPNGNWSLHKFHDSPGCTCENPGSVISDMGATSLALLPFLGAGQTHIDGKYKDHVREGLDYLLDNQIPDGDLSFGARGNTRMYTHGQATIVLCEALMMTGDRRLRNPAQDAVNFIVKSQHSAGGWRYQPGQPGDTSVVGWQVMALQSAHAAGLIVPSQTLNKANQYLDQAQSPNSLYGYMPGGSFTYVMTAEALLCRFYLGYNQKSPGVEYGINYLMKNHLPAKPPFNMYYMYYGTQLMHHYGGQPWKTWNTQMQDLLIASQKTNGHRAGSWTPVESHDRGGGRLYTTAMAVCCLEVYYRHLPIFRKLDLE